MVRVWGTVEDRLIEVVPGPAGEPGFRIEGLPDGRARTTADRVRAALVNSRVLPEVPAVVLRLIPAITRGSTDRLDLSLALSVLTHVGRIGRGCRWIHAIGSLGLDGTIHRSGASNPPTLAELVRSLCHTPLVDSEHMFGMVER